MSQEAEYAQSWEKLFSYIVKGDRVRALALYRLLQSTNKDSAYAIKLKADILWATGRPEALDEYVRMAEEYEKQGCIVSALSVIAMLIKIAPDTQDYHLIYSKLQRLKESLH